MRAAVVVAALAAAAALVAACPGALQDPAAFTAACPDVPSQIFAMRCAGSGCHGADAPAASLDLVSPGVAERLYARPAAGGPGLLIDPANPDGSVLVRKLTPTPPFGAQQPPGAPLDPATIDCIRRWVRSVGIADLPPGASD